MELHFKFEVFIKKSLWVNGGVRRPRGNKKEKRAPDDQSKRSKANRKD
jgi:hypothetical protein